MKRVLFLLIITVFVFLIISPVYKQVNANTDLTNYSGITPDKTIRYPLKRIKEKVSVIFLSLFNKKSLGSYQLKLLNDRTNELFYLAEHDKLPFIETAVSRYITQVGLVKDQLELDNVSGGKVTALLAGVYDKFEKLRDEFPAQSSMWLLYQQASDSTKVLVSDAQSK